MPTIVIQSSIRKGSADALLNAMEKLLELRRYRKITRRSFLKRWGYLREKLAKTPEYQRFRVRVIRRAGGQCEERNCKTVGTQVHHIKPVAFFPRLALETKNGMLLCRSCHFWRHPHMRKSK